MGKNNNLAKAKKAKNDEFYTQYQDIESEMNAYYEYNNDVFRDKVILCPCDDPEWSNFTKYFAQNFERFGLKKLISTSYAQNANGKFLALTKDTNKSGYLEGDGDFRSEEVTKLRDESDVIITNPPFSLFREFLAWILEGEKNFIIMGNKNSITYKDVFPLLKDNKMWLGTQSPSEFDTPEGTTKKVAGLIRWFTNLDHNLRHEKLRLMTMRENLKYNKKLKKKFENDYGVLEYPKYDNYDAIEVPFVDAIPSDYVPCWFKCDNAERCFWALSEGMDSDKDALCESKNTGCMGVPITYMDKHRPDQFEVVGFDLDLAKPMDTIAEEGTYEKGGPAFYLTNNNLAETISSEKRREEKRREEKRREEKTSPPLLKNRYPPKKKCNGIIGVPITFLDKFNSSQFEILGVFNHGSDGPWDFASAQCNEKEKFKRLAIRQKM